MLAFIVGFTLAPGSSFSFMNNPPYAPGVSTPESILRYEAGARHTTFREQESVFEAIAANCPKRVRQFQYGTTAEGRPLRVFAIGSESNISNLASIQRDHQRLAQGEGSPDKVVPIVWINECIHGDETASFESAMWTFYNLAASRNPKIEDALKNVVVMLNPVYNPDGHERYVVYYNSIATGSSNPLAFEDREPRIVSGRLNHYRFDMNRDRIAFSQIETRTEFAEMLKWNPQVYIDQHGQVASYFFPPEPESININVDRARNAKWTDYFGRATGQAFDRLGMSFFVKDTFDLYYPGYLDSSNTLTGAIGMTHETDGGRLLATTRSDGSTLTLRQGMSKHYTSAIAVVEASAAKHQELIDDYATFKKRACTGVAAGKFQRVVLTSDDVRPLERMKEHLGFAGIRSHFAKPFTQADAHDYWTGKSGSVSFTGNLLVIDLAQPQGAFAKALLEPQSEFEPEFIKSQISKKKSAPDGEKYPGPDSAEFYDTTGWSLPFAYGLRAWWCESTPTTIVPSPEELGPKAIIRSTTGYALQYSDEDDILAVFEALQEGVRGMVTEKPMKLGSKNFKKGTFLFLAGRNEENYVSVLERVGRKRHVQFEPITSSYPDEGRDGPGSESVRELKHPSIAVVMGSGDRLNDCGAIWFLLEQRFHLPFTFVSEEALAGNPDGFTAVVIPNGSPISKTDRFREWLDKGNVAVILGNARTASTFQDLPVAKGEIQSLPGSLFLGQMDSRSFLSDGYTRPEIAVPFEGDHFFLKRKEGGSIITLSGVESVHKLLTGWEWPDDTEKNLRDALFLQDIPVGQGHLVVYTQDPTARAMWPGLYKTLLNAILIGSSK